MQHKARVRVLFVKNSLSQTATKLSLVGHFAFGILLAKLSLFLIGVSIRYCYLNFSFAFGLHVLFLIEKNAIFRSGICSVLGARIHLCFECYASFVQSNCYCEIVIHLLIYTCSSYLASVFYNQVVYLCLFLDLPDNLLLPTH